MFENFSKKNVTKIKSYKKKTKKNKKNKKKMKGAYDAPIHAVIGNGGQGLSDTPKPIKDWNHWGISEWGWNEIQIFNQTHLQLRFYFENDTLAHETTIYRKR